MESTDKIYIEIKVGPLLEQPVHAGLFPMKEGFSAYEYYLMAINGLADMIDEEYWAEDEL